MKNNKPKKQTKFTKTKRFAIFVASVMLICIATTLVLAFTNHAHNTNAYADFVTFDEYGCINNQADLHNFKYGFSTLNTNGCGSIAVFNVLQLAQKDIEFPDVVKAMDIFAQNAFGFLGTNPIAMAFYLRSQGIDAFVSFNPQEFDEFASTSHASIYGYLSLQGGHYTTMHPIGEGMYQLHNPSRQSNFENLLQDTSQYKIKFLIYTKF